MTPTATQPPAVLPSYNLDGHKLHHHSDAVARWLKGETLYPLYLEFSPVGKCNHRCVFCAYDYLGYQDRKLDAEKTKQVLRDLGKGGTKSCLFAGEGEPLLHPDMPEFARVAAGTGVDVGIFSNAALLTERKAEALLPHLTFLRCSLNGGDAETYAKVHQVKPQQFDLVLKNLERAAELKRKHGWKVTLGVQFVMLPDNIRSVVPLARRLQSIGVDYLALKPYVLHPDQVTLRWEGNFGLDEVEPVFQEAEKEASETFQVIARRDSFRKYGTRSYGKCLALPFFAFVLSDGNVYTCGPFYGNDAHVYGNIHQQAFPEIWEGVRREKVLDYVENRLDCSVCMPNCRPDAANRFLWELKHPPQHVNFI